MGQPIPFVVTAAHSLLVLSIDVADDWLEASGWVDAQTKLNCFPKLQVGGRLQCLWLHLWLYLRQH